MSFLDKKKNKETIASDVFLKVNELCVGNRK